MQLTGSSSFGARSAVAWEAHAASPAICCQLKIWPLAFLQGNKHIPSSTSGRLRDTGSLIPHSLMKIAQTQCQSSRQQKHCNRAEQIFSAEFCVCKKKKHSDSQALTSQAHLEGISSSDKFRESLPTSTEICFSGGGGSRMMHLVLILAGLDGVWKSFVLVEGNMRKVGEEQSSAVLA